MSRQNIFHLTMIFCLPNVLNQERVFAESIAVFFDVSLLNSYKILIFDYSHDLLVLEIKRLTQGTFFSLDRSFNCVNAASLNIAELEIFT